MEKDILNLTKKEFENLFYEHTKINIKNGCDCKLNRRIKRLEEILNKKIIIL